MFWQAISIIRMKQSHTFSCRLFRLKPKAWYLALIYRRIRKKYPTWSCCSSRVSLPSKLFLIRLSRKTVKYTHQSKGNRLPQYIPRIHRARSRHSLFTSLLRIQSSAKSISQTYRARIYISHLHIYSIKSRISLRGSDRDKYWPDAFPSANRSAPQYFVIMKGK